MTKMGRIGVLMGGVSAERDVSLKSGKGIWQALSDSGYDVRAIDITTSDSEQIKVLLREQDISIAFNILHGCFGEDGQIQAILDEMRIPFPGSGVPASQVSFHKIQTQKILRDHGIPVPEFCEVARGQGDIVAFLRDQGLDVPFVVKPDDSGSSLGVSVVHDWSQCEDACQKAFVMSENLLVDRFIDGREMTVGILDGQALSVIEICPRQSFFDFKAKYQKGMTDYLIPAPIIKKLGEQLQFLALKVYNILGCEDFARVDFMVGKDLQPRVLEINTLPGFTPTSLLPMAAEYQGISFNSLCVKLVELAYGKAEAKKNTSFIF